jgi:metal-responsive CopG/Arc/MetJ family transcriptional regulator
MKQTFTISLDEELAAAIREVARFRRDKFRNKSHLVEEAIRNFLNEQRGKQNGPN